jgi:hypothetical protein
LYTTSTEDIYTIVYLALRELALRADYTPDNGRSAEYLGIWADKAVLLGGGAHILDIGEHPGLDAQLRSASYDGCDDLAPEHDARRYLHVMTELKVRSELQGLSHGDIAPGLEHHHGDGLARESVTNDQLRNDVETHLLIGDGLDHTNRDHVQESCAV